jgi:hypothetical protein
VGVGKLLVLMATGSILFSKKDIITKAFQASNCGYEID